MPYFNQYLNINLKFSIINNSLAILIILIFTLGVGILAGSYPAFFISSFEPVKVLHGSLNKGIKKPEK